MAIIDNYKQFSINIIAASSQLHVVCTGNHFKGHFSERNTLHRIQNVIKIIFSLKHESDSNTFLIMSAYF